MHESFVDNDCADITVEEIVELYSDMLLRIALQNMRNLQDAEDVVQDTFMKYLALNDFNSETHRKAWLIRVCINLCKEPSLNRHVA